MAKNIAVLVEVIPPTEYHKLYSDVWNLRFSLLIVCSDFTFLPLWIKKYMLFEHFVSSFRMQTKPLCANNETQLRMSCEYIHNAGWDFLEFREKFLLREIAALEIIRARLSIQMRIRGRSQAPAQRRLGGGATPPAAAPSLRRSLFVSAWIWVASRTVKAGFISPGKPYVYCNTGIDYRSAPPHRPDTVAARAENPPRRCHERLSSWTSYTWPSLADMCTKVT